MALPLHNFVTTCSTDHLGFPAWDEFMPVMANVTGSTMGNTPAAPFVLQYQQVLQYGINCQRVTIAYTPNAATAALTWQSGAHDFVVGEWLNLRGWGGVTTTGVDNYYEVTAAPDNTHATIAIPVDARAAFAPNVLGTETIDDLLHGYVWLLMDGQGSVTNDLAAAKHTTTYTNTAVTLSATDSKFGATCLAIGASGKLVSSNASCSAHVNPMNRFCVDAWIKRTATHATDICTIIRLNDDASVAMAIVDDKLVAAEGQNIRVTSTDAVPLNVWTHVAMTRTNGVLKLFVNGVMQAGSYSTGIVMTGYSSQKIRLFGDTTKSFLGNVQNIRLTQGHNRWTGDFTPPEYQPTLKPGIGYFVTRGGNIIRGVTDATYKNGLNPSAFHTSKLAFENEAALVNYEGVTGQLKIIPANSPYNRLLTIQNQVGSSAAQAEGCIWQASTDSTTDFRGVPTPYMQFIFSNAGAYCYMQHMPRTTNAWTRSSLTYFGFGNDLFRAYGSYRDGFTELASNLVACGFGTSSTQNVSTIGADAVAQASYHSAGLLYAHLGASLATANTAMIGMMSRTVANTNFGWISAYNRRLAQRYDTGGSATVEGATQAGGYSTGSTWYQPVVYGGSRQGLGFPGLVVAMTAIPNTLGIKSANPFKPKVVNYMRYGVTARKGLLMQGPATKGIISLDPSDWNEV